jgi:hypothetical protein
MDLALESSNTLALRPLPIMNLKLKLIQFLLSSVIDLNLYYVNKLTFIRISTKSSPTATPILQQLMKLL